MDVWRAAAGRARAPLQSFLVLFPAFSFRSERKGKASCISHAAADADLPHILNHSLIVVGACRVVGVGVPGAQQSRDTTQHAAAGQRHRNAAAQLTLGTR